MQKISLKPNLLKNLKPISIKLITTQKQLDIFQHSILPKFLSFFENKQKQMWKTSFNNQLPNKHTNFKNETDYLKANDITKVKIVQNSIQYVLNDINNEDLEILTNYFSIFTNSNKIRITKKDNVNITIYVEIIESLKYINKIRQIIDNYPKFNGNHLGTKYSSSNYKKHLESQKKTLVERLNSSFFKLTNGDEIKKIKSQIKFIELSLVDEYKNLPEWLNYVSIYLGFESKFFDFTKFDIIMFKQLTSFFNGAKTSKEELLKSITIFLKDRTQIKNEDKELHKNYAENIMDIIRYFFHDIIKEIESSKKKKTFSYNKKNIIKQYQIKTYIDNIPIFVYSNLSQSNHLNELYKNSFESMKGLQNIFDKTNLNKTQLSVEEQEENFSKSLQSIFNFTDEELKVFNHLSKLF